MTEGCGYAIEPHATPNRNQRHILTAVCLADAVLCQSVVNDYQNETSTHVVQEQHSNKLYW
jgi:hypothetical protein